MSFSDLMWGIMVILSAGFLYATATHPKLECIAWNLPTIENGLLKPKCTTYSVKDNQ